MNTFDDDGPDSLGLSERMVDRLEYEHGALTKVFCQSKEIKSAVDRTL